MNRNAGSMMAAIMDVPSRLGVLAALTVTVAVAGQTGNQKSLSLSEPSHHLFADRMAREPMLVEHPSGALFVAGYGTPAGSTDLPPNLWKSTDRGKTWSIVDVGSPAKGAVGNSDVDLAMGNDGTLYFVSMTFDRKSQEGTDINIGVSLDTGATWTWTRLSQTRWDDRPWVEVAPDGTAHVIWNDGEGISHAVSTDRGRTWTERPRIHPEGGSSHLAVGHKGQVAVRVTPHSASGFKIHQNVDVIAVSVDRGETWQKHRAPGERTWTPMSELKKGGLPRWVEPLAWDAAGSLYSLWTDTAGVRLARSSDLGNTWQQWLIMETKDATAFFPYVVGRGPGELAATWFSAKLPDYTTLRAHLARISVQAATPPQVMASLPFTFEAVTQSGVLQSGGEYIPVAFLRDGTLALVTPIQNLKAKRLGFSWWLAN
jgi:hypothetical protein